VQDLFPTAAEAGGRFTALILVRNTGKEPHSIAVSRDFAVLKAGNQGKQELALYLRITPPPPFKPIVLPGAIAAGSTSVAGSLAVLAPQESVLFRIQASLSATSQWHDSGLDASKASVTAEVVESSLATTEFVVTKTSPIVKSSNEIEVYWHY
jgi:hypothetical protein